jgi:hypothetical protein
MAVVTLTFTAPLNASCQIGDKAYYVIRQDEGGFSTNNGDVIEIGEIRQIDNRDSSAPVVKCNSSIGGSVNNDEEFILFSKDNKANLSSILGYYAEIKMVSNSVSNSELFSVGMDMFESSK